MSPPDRPSAPCLFCDHASAAFRDVLLETDNFRIVCDWHPLTEGHMLIIPKEHVTCVGAFSAEMFAEFLDHYERARDFLTKHFGSVSTFEHGNVGQTVFHSHIHLLPYKGDPLTIVPEGREKLVALPSFGELQKLYQHYDRYLFFSINDLAWVVDTSLAAPRFFRDRFAAALGRPERGNWQENLGEKEWAEIARKDNERVKVLWEKDDA